MIIGITGTNGAGKGTIVEFLKNIGFAHYSVRKFLEEEIGRRNMPSGRDSMINLANELRAMHGSAYIIEQLYEQARVQGGDSVIESIRAIGEVESLRGKSDFYLFAVDADPRIRYERIFQRGSSTDRISYAQFLEQESREMQNQDMNKQNLARCIAMADYRFENNGTIPELEKKVMEAIDGIR